MAKKIVKVNARGGIARIPESGTWLLVGDVPNDKVLVEPLAVEVVAGSKCNPTPCGVCAFGPFRSRAASVTWFKRNLLNKSF